VKPVADYIPHQPPMRVIGELIAAEEYQVVAAASVDADNVFFNADMGGVPAWVGIEYMAQAAAVWVGLHCERRGRPIAPAFLLSSRQYTAHQPVFTLGQQLKVQVHADLVEEPIVAFTGKITDDSGHLLVEAIFSAYQPDDLEAFLQQSDPEGG